MTDRSPENLRVLAIDPSGRGFGFAVFEGPHRLIDWGVTASRRNPVTWPVLKAADLITAYQPAVVCLENLETNRNERGDPARLVVNAIADLALRRTVLVRTFSREQVRRAFAEDGAHTKHEIALAICRLIPELAPHEPRVRKPWMSADSRMPIFSAAALALTFFRRMRRRSESTNSNG